MGGPAHGIDVNDGVLVADDEARMVDGVNGSYVSTARRNGVALEGGPG